MAYRMYMDGILFPVTPAKVQMKIRDQNKTLNLIGGEEINLLKAAGLTEVSFELLLPQTSYPFAAGAQSADYYLGLLERLKTEKKPFQWIMNRQRPNGKALFYTNLTVSLEDYQITENAAEGFDITVKVTLKQYKKYGTKSVTITPPPSPAEKPVATVDAGQRDTGSAPNVTAYTVKYGDCLWNIAKKYLGDGTRYTELYTANKAVIDAHHGGPNMIWPGDVLKIPAV